MEGCKGDRLVGVAEEGDVAKQWLREPILSNTLFETPATIAGRLGGDNLRLNATPGILPDNTLILNFW